MVDQYLEVCFSVHNKSSAAIEYASEKQYRPVIKLQENPEASKFLADGHRSKTVPKEGLAFSHRQIYQYHSSFSNPELYDLQNRVLRNSLCRF
jgi:hypothetical protein